MPLPPPPILKRVCPSVSARNAAVVPRTWGDRLLSATILPRLLRNETPGLRHFQSSRTGGGPSLPTSTTAVVVRVKLCWALAASAGVLGFSWSGASLASKYIFGP